MADAARGPATRMADELAALRRDLAGRVPPEVLDRVVDEAVRELDGARITDFVPVLVHRSVRRRVRALAPGVADSPAAAIP